jgi:chromosome segregation ATPase
MPDEHEDDDRTIVDALSALGWVEESEKGAVELPADLEEQLNLFKQENQKLTDEVNRLSQQNEQLKKEKEASMLVLENHKVKIENLETKITSSTNEEEVLRMTSLLNDLDNTIKEKQRYIQELFSSSSKQNNMIEEQNSIIEQQNALLEVKNKEIVSFQTDNEELNATISSLNEQIIQITKQKNENENMAEQVNVLDSQIEELKREQAETENIIEKLQGKENKIKELNEQLQYLEGDTVQKSKFEKVNLLLEKKDEIITEKEKAIFEVQNELTSANQRINDLQQQLETFSLVKKDLTKKEERIKTLVFEIEELKQKDITNLNLKNQLEEQLNAKEIQMQEAEDSVTALQNQLNEAEIMEDKILNDLQKVKDENLKSESQLERQEQELIELKKRVKMMRRDMSKS